jgi:thiosulfate reductase cytochrome b subunit
MSAPRVSPALVRRNHWVVRLTHWVNVVAVVIMAGSGMRIFNAHPAFARPGESFPLNPWEGHAIPAWLTFGAWLGGARHWHFAAMWLLVANAALYVGFLALHGEWRDITPRRGDLRGALEMLKFYLYARRTHPRQGKHNALQKGAYFAMPVLGLVLVLSGLAIWKPVTLGWLTALFVNYKWARVTHFAAMAALLLLAIVHVFMVFAVDPWALRSMVTGWYDRTRSPEARNARPFQCLFARGPIDETPDTERNP